MRKINKHIIHCSDSTFGNVAIIRQWHLNRGWRDVGYHFIILTDGEIEVGRTLDTVGAHCKYQNNNSVGTCLIGKDSFTQKQFSSLRRIHKMLEGLFPSIQALPHHHFNLHKTCPNFDVKKELQL